MMMPQYSVFHMHQATQLGRPPARCLPMHILQTYTPQYQWPTPSARPPRTITGPNPITYTRKQPPCGLLSRSPILHRQLGRGLLFAMARHLHTPCARPARNATVCICEKPDCLTGTVNTMHKVNHSRATAPTSGFTNPIHSVGLPCNLYFLQAL